MPFIPLWLLPLLGSSGCASEDEAHATESQPTSASAKTVFPKPSKPATPPLSLDAFLMRHTEDEALRYDLQMLFGQDMIFRTDDVARFANKDRDAVRAMFLQPDSPLIVGLCYILSMPLSDQDKFGKVNAWLENPDAESMDGLVRLDMAKPAVGFSEDNPIRELLQLEGEVHPEMQAPAEDFISRVISQVNVRFHPGMTSIDFMKLAWSTIKKTNMNRIPVMIVPQADPLLISNLSNGVLDCDTSSFVLLAVAHEFGVQASFVTVPEHAFLSLDDGTYFDQGEVENDLQAMKGKYGIGDVAFSKKTYLTNINPVQLRGIFQANVATAWYKEWLAHHEKPSLDRAFELFTQAERSNPTSPMVLNGLGAALKGEGRLDLAEISFTQALGYDPDCAMAHENLGDLLLADGDKTRAAVHFKAALVLFQAKKRAQTHIIIQARLDKLIEKCESQLARCGVTPTY